MERGIRRVIVPASGPSNAVRPRRATPPISAIEVDYVSEATLTFAMSGRDRSNLESEEIKARTELVARRRFARIATVEQALEAGIARLAA